MERLLIRLRQRLLLPQTLQRFLSLRHQPRRPHREVCTFLQHHSLQKFSLVSLEFYLHFSFSRARKSNPRQSFPVTPLSFALFSFMPSISITIPLEAMPFTLFLIAMHRHQLVNVYSRPPHNTTKKFTIKGRKGITDYFGKPQNVAMKRFFKVLHE